MHMFNETALQIFSHKNFHPTSSSIFLIVKSSILYVSFNFWDFYHKTSFLFQSFFFFLFVRVWVLMCRIEDTYRKFVQFVIVQKLIDTKKKEKKKKRQK